MTQKFHHGDLVRVADDLGPSMGHFRAGCDAIVCYSYAEQYGGDNHKSYSIHFQGHGETSWYDESHLTLIEPGRKDLLDRWRRAEEDERLTKANLDWIFQNGEDVFTQPHGASIQALANCLGCTDLWGSRGEGVDYYHNFFATISHAEPFLKSGDLPGWERYANEYQDRAQGSAGERFLE